MTDITALPSAGTLTGSELIALFQGSGAVKLALSDLLFKNASGNVGLGTTATSDRMTIGGAARVERSGTPLQYIQTYGDGSSNFFGSFSLSNNAKMMTFESTTDAAHTTPTSGAVGHIWRVLGSERVRINQAGYLAINTTSPRAWLHVKNGTSGSSLTPATGALIEGSSTATLSIETTNTGFGQIRFIDPENIRSGMIEYSHGSETLSFVVGDTSLLRLEADGTLRPWNDNAFTLGRSAYRWSVVYAGTGTINTSDAREKTELRPLSDAELRAARRIANGIGAFQWIDAIERKGDGARLHIGVIAQDVIAALEAEGLDPFRYAFVCHDAWEEEREPIIETRTVTKTRTVRVQSTTLFDRGGNPAMIEKEEDYVEEETFDTGKTRVVLAAGDRYGIRPDQLNLFLSAALNQRLAALEAAIAA